MVDRLFCLHARVVDDILGSWRFGKDQKRYTVLGSVYIPE